MHTPSLLTTLLAFSSLVPAQEQPPCPPLQSILASAYQAPLYTYPTSLTQGIVPKNLHSHNDCKHPLTSTHTRRTHQLIPLPIKDWRPLPFYSALSVGAISVEADVWLYNSTLHVGHEESALTPARTFSALYIDPILDVLRRQNPSSSPYVPETDRPTRNGVFDTSSAQTLYLYVDMKTDGADTFPVVSRALPDHRHRALEPHARGGLPHDVQRERGG